MKVSRGKWGTKAGAKKEEMDDNKETEEKEEKEKRKELETMQKKEHHYSRVRISRRPSRSRKR